MDRVPAWCGDSWGTKEHCLRLESHFLHVFYTAITKLLLRLVVFLKVHHHIACHCTCRVLHLGGLASQGTDNSSTSTTAAAVSDDKRSSRMRQWRQSSLNQSLSRGISFELEASAPTQGLAVDESGSAAGRRRGSLLQAAAAGTDAY